MHEIDDARDGRVAIERGARPPGAETAPLRELEGGAPQPFDGSVFVRRTRPQRPARSPQRAADACGRVLEARLPPAVERLLEQPLRLPFGEHAEQRIDPRLDRPFAQQIGAETVNGADVRFLAPLDRAFNPRRRARVARVAALLFESLPKAQLQLT